MECDINYTNKSLDLLRRILVLIQNSPYYNAANLIVRYNKGSTVEVQNFIKKFEIDSNAVANGVVFFWISSNRG